MCIPTLEFSKLYMAAISFMTSDNVSAISEMNHIGLSGYCFLVGVLHNCRAVLVGIALYQQAELSYGGIEVDPDISAG